MTAEIKVLHVSAERLTKAGKPYRKVLVLIIINGNEFVDHYYVF